VDIDTKFKTTTNNAEISTELKTMRKLALPSKQREFNINQYTMRKSILNSKTMRKSLLHSDQCGNQY